MDKPTSAKPGSGLIIVRLLGGLGNQMFQYAMGRSLSITHNRALKLDLGFYSSKKAAGLWAPRSYGLGHFSIAAEIATEADTAPFQKYLGQDFFSKALRRMSGFGNYHSGAYIFERPGRNFTFDQRLLSAQLGPVVYLDGFWQTEKYFSQIEDIIRQDFSFKEQPDEINRKLLAEISLANSVCVHIRHGDNAGPIAAKHGVLALGYYFEAIKDLVSKIPNPHFYIFSDDPAWAKENLKLSYPAIFVSHNGDAKNYEDLRLMAHCKHHIIGNSTFSWWGAYLGKAPGQFVYAPSRYHMSANIAMGDYYPNHWKLIKV